jgi:hypothetical protein
MSSDVSGGGDVARNSPGMLSSAPYTSSDMDARSSSLKKVRMPRTRGSASVQRSCVRHILAALRVRCILSTR